MRNDHAVIVEVLDQSGDVVAWLGTDGLTPARWEARLFPTIETARSAARCRALAGVATRVISSEDRRTVLA